MNFSNFSNFNFLYIFLIFINMFPAICSINIIYWTLTINHINCFITLLLIRHPTLQQNLSHTRTTVYPRGLEWWHHSWWLHDCLWTVASKRCVTFKNWDWWVQSFMRVFYVSWNSAQYVSIIRNIDKFIFLGK